MRLLQTAPTVEDYCHDLDGLFKDSRTHFYFDTSFLFWLSGLGESARSEFFSWVATTGIERFHVPLWASHEYHQHLLDATVEKQFNDPIQKLAEALSNFYEQAMPALVEAEEMPRWPAGSVKLTARNAASELLRCGNTIDNWAKQTWIKRSGEVIDFVNQRCIKSGATFEELETIGALTENRFNGRVPPGFEDRGKKATNDRGGNRAGDLLFWREILTHAKRANRFLKKVSAIVIMSNDRKNDWVTGGKPSISNGSVDALKGVRDDWSRIPVIHPMLEHEAKVFSKAHRTVIVNSFALGTYFLKDGRSPTFVEATVTTQVPKKSQKESTFRKPDKTERATPMRRSKSTNVELDTAGDSTTQKTEEEVTSYQIQAEAARYLNEKNAEAEASVKKLLALTSLELQTQEWAKAEMNVDSPKDCFAVAVILTRSAIKTNGASADRLSDLLRVLGELDSKIATFVYAGVLFGFYFDEQNSPQRVPGGQLMQLIFAHQKSSFAKAAIKALVEAFDASGPERPAYVPDVNAPTITAKIQYRVHNKKTLLSAVIIGDIDYLIPVEEASPVALTTLLGITGEKERTAAAQEIILVCARVLGIPITQIELKDDHDRRVVLSPTDGLNIPMYEEADNG